MRLKTGGLEPEKRENEDDSVLGCLVVSQVGIPHFVRNDTP